MELTAVDVMEGVIATVEEIVVVDDVIVAELELVVPVTRGSGAALRRAC